MVKIPVNDLIALFQRMYKEHWRYIWGKAEEGCVDCSGAFVYAYSRFKKTIAHGSNTIARNAVVKLLPISQAQPGMAAFKIREPGDPKYALPAKFRKGGSAYNGDLNDYYHIGLVDEGGKYVLNAQGENAGFTRTKISLWGAVGYLKAVDYQKGEMPMQTMIVKAENGQPVKVREAPSTNAAILTRLNVGTRVEAGEDTNGWREIVFGDSGGYMMSKFLKEADSGEAYVRTLTSDEYNRLCDARDQAKSVYDTLKEIVGVG